MPIPNPNTRNLEPRLAPRFQEALITMPPSRDKSYTKAWVMALVADAVHWKASDIHLVPGTLETRIRLRVDGVLHDAAVLPNASGHRLVSFSKPCPASMPPPWRGRSTAMAL